MELNQTTIDKIDQLIPRYPDKRSAALPLCHLVQEDLGYLSNESIVWIADRLELQPINISELVTFYPMLRDEAPGKYQVRVCRTLPCALAGAYKTCKQFEEAFDCKVGSTSDDGLITLEYVECHADCGKAPVVMVGEKEYTDVGSSQAEVLIDKIKNGTVETK
jgi:NADH-quinone oxidoreductase subunit E